MIKLNKGTDFTRRRKIADQTRASDLGIDEFFIDDDRPTKRAARWLWGLIPLVLIASAVFLFLSWNLPPAGDSDFEVFEVPFSYASANQWMLISGFIATTLASLCASFIAIEFVNRANVRRNNLVRGLTQEGALKEVLRVLQGYNGRYSENKNIEVVFEKIEEAEIEGTQDKFQAMSVVITVKQRMPITQGNLIFDFATVDRNDKIADKIRLSLQSSEVPHDAYIQDITDIRKHFPDRVNDMFPGLVQVVINSKPQKLLPVRVNGIPTYRRWHVDTKEYRGTGMVSLLYRYRYYVEVPGYCFFSVSEPTKGFLCSLNYDGVQDKINVYDINMINNRVFEHGADQFKKKGHISFDDWVIPNSNVTFCWYKKNSKDPGEGKMAGIDTSELNVDGNCLGLALLEVFNTLDVDAPDVDYALLSEPADAADVLLPYFRVLALEKETKIPGAGHWFRMSAKRAGVEICKIDDIQDEDVILCERSMLQLYRMKRPELHWVVLSKDESGEWTIHDGLRKSLENNVNEEDFAKPEELLKQQATTLVVRSKT